LVQQQSTNEGRCQHAAHNRLFFGCLIHSFVTHFGSSLPQFWLSPPLPQIHLPFAFRPCLFEGHLCKHTSFLFFHQPFWHFGFFDCLGNPGQLLTYEPSPSLAQMKRAKPEGQRPFAPICFVIDFIAAWHAIVHPAPRACVTFLPTSFLGAAFSALFLH